MVPRSNWNQHFREEPDFEAGRLTRVKCQIVSSFQATQSSVHGTHPVRPAEFELDVLRGYRRDQAAARCCIVLFCQFQGMSSWIRFAG